VSDAFDPYHEWLGIPPKDQPPNHYRLLGIDLFEGKAKVIESAADRQMAHVRNYQTGKHSELSQNLLNEIARAKITLLNPRKKAAYDEQLTGRLRPQPPTAEPPVVAKAIPTPPAPVPPAAPAAKPAAADFPGLRSSAGVTTGRIHRRRRKSAGPQAAILGTIAVVLAVVFFAIVFSHSGPSVEVAEHKSPAPRPIVKQPRRKPASPPKARRRRPRRPAPQPEIPRHQTPISAPDEDTEENTAIDESLLPTENATLPTRPPSRPSDGRLPVPEEADWQKAIEELRKIFADEYAAANRLEGKLALTEALLKQAETSKADPVARYVLLREALRLAVESGKIQFAYDALKPIIDDYEVDAWKERVTSLEELAETVRDNENRHLVAGAALDLVEPAIEENCFEEAARLAAVGLAAATRGRDIELRKRARRVRDRARQRLAEWNEVRPALDTLAQRPDDSEANLDAGRYFCFVRGDWQRGLPYLAKGSDAALRTAAEADLDAPAEAAGQTKLGDSWWTLAEGLTALAEQRAARVRAGHWYRLARPRLAGLEKVRVDKRLDEIAKPPAASGNPVDDAKVTRGRWVDLLGLVDLKRDTLKGAWQRIPKGITSVGSEGASVALPVLVEGSYDLEVEFVRHSGTDTMGIGLPVGPEVCTLCLSGWNGGGSSLTRIDGKEDHPAAIKRPGKLVNGQRYVVAAKVRLAGSDVDIRIWLNGVPYLGWSGKQASVSPTTWWTPCLNRPALVGHTANVTFHAARLRLVSGKASLVTADNSNLKSFLEP